MQGATSWQQRYMRAFYNSKPEWIDGTEEFHRLCGERLGAGSRILEIGAGPSNNTSRFLATLGELHGADPDAAVASNDALRSAGVIDRDRIPFADASFDGCVSNYVLEHVSDPFAHLREVRRVLRPGGSYIFRTPNRYHYVPMISRWTPHWFHTLVANRLRNQPADAHDPYPTYYACNSPRDIVQHAAAADLDVAEIRMIEKEPSYGMSSRVLFLAFMAYERIVNSTEAAAKLRANILAVLRKR